MEEGKQVGIFAVVQMKDDNGLGWDEGSRGSEKQVDLGDKENTWIWSLREKEESRMNVCSKILLVW